jgi:hypothetical protein
MPKSSFCKQNLKEIFSDSSLTDGLKILNSPFDLAETLPIVGVGLRLKRNQGCEKNPWLVHVKGVNRTHQAIDTGPLIPLHTKEHFP